MSNDREPLVRARLCQDWLKLVAEEEEPYKGRFFARVDAPLRETIESASRVAWIPLVNYVRLADILQETFGAVRAHAYYRRAFVTSLDTPLLKPIFDLGARLLGLTPATAVRWLPKGWDAAFKDAGRIVGEVLGPGRARLIYEDLPEVFTASEGWVLSCPASAYGVYDVLRVDGVIRLDLTNRRTGSIVMELEWTERGK
jgi:hypothetical protein